MHILLKLVFFYVAKDILQKSMWVPSIYMDDICISDYILLYSRYAL